MKKSLIALAVLATTGAAFAQSSVTLYGRIDASVGSSKVGAPGAAASSTQLFSGALTSTRWGLRGSEDLGGGLKAIFGLEQGFDASNGTQAAGSAFDRQSIVGLSGGFGAVKFGRHDTSFDDIRDLTVSSNIFDSGTFATTEGVVGTSGYAGVGQLADYGDRASNQIRYESPSFGGFSAGFSYGLDEQSAPVKRDVTAFNLRYKAGSLDVGYGYQENANEVAASNLEYNTLGAAYNFGSFRISGGWNQVKNKASRKSDAYSIGAIVPVGALDFSLGYSTAKAKQGSATFEKGDAFSAAVAYNMSKRTRLYAGLTTGDIENAAGTKVREREVYALGLAHTF
ncbi:MAG: porin [Pseudomonadota bacterium]